MPTPKAKSKAERLAAGAAALHSVGIYPEDMTLEEQLSLLMRLLKENPDFEMRLKGKSITEGVLINSKNIKDVKVVRRRAGSKKLGKR